MPYALSRLGQIPIRHAPSERAEMVSQLLYGESVEIVDFQHNWTMVRTVFDNYEGWISAGQLQEMLETSNHLPDAEKTILCSPLANINNHLPQPTLIGFGSEIQKSDKISASGLVKTFPNFQLTSDSVSAKNIVENAQLLLGTPYLWGGRSVFGIDCSGFVQLLFKVAGIALPRDAWQQAEKGEPIDFIEEAKTGDLAFFDNEEGKINHVALIVDSKNVIHASGYVRKDAIDHHGIFNNSIGKYTHKLRIIKRI
ncbi:MAG: cell wall-associated hydrolase [Bacteroidetes bacterium]|nr:MAG: cell wall-associated hydrolase [Bacteroidota bacterium]